MVDMGQVQKAMKIKAFDALQELIACRGLNDHQLKLLFFFLKIYNEPRRTLKDVKQFHGLPELLPAITKLAKEAKKQHGEVFFSTQRNKLYASWKKLQQAKLIERIPIEKDIIANERLYPEDKVQLLEKFDRKTWKSVFRPVNHSCYLQALEQSLPKKRLAVKSGIIRKDGSVIPWYVVHITLYAFFSGDMLETEFNEIQKLETEAIK